MLLFWLGFICYLFIYFIISLKPRAACQFCQCVIPNKPEVLGWLNKEGQTLVRDSGFHPSANYLQFSEKIPGKEAVTTTPFSVTTNSYDFQDLATFEHLVYPGL